MTRVPPRIRLAGMAKTGGASRSSAVLHVCEEETDEAVIERDIPTILGDAVRQRGGGAGVVHLLEDYEIPPPGLGDVSCVYGMAAHRLLFFFACTHFIMCCSCRAHVT